MFPSLPSSQPQSGDYLSSFNQQLQSFTNYANQNYPLSDLVTPVADTGTSAGNTAAGIAGVLKGIAGGIISGKGPIGEAVAGPKPPNDFFGVSASRIAAFILGLILIAGAVFMFKPELAPEAVKGVIAGVIA